MAMEFKKTQKSDELTDFAMVLDQTLQRRDRVDAIISSLKDEVYNRPQQQFHDQSIPEYTQIRRELLLRGRLDPEAEIILNDVKAAVTTISDKAVQASVIKFLSAYDDLLTQEKYICGQDRETVLMNLKKDLERMGDLHALDSNSFGSSDDGTQINNMRQIDSQSDLERVSEKNEVFEKSVFETLNNLNKLQDKHKQLITTAKIQMESMRACFEFRTIKTVAGRDELISRSGKLSEELSNLKETLSSNGHKRCEDFQKTVDDSKKKLAEAREMFKGWKMQEILFSSLVEHKTKTLTDMQASNGKDTCATLKNEFERKEHKLQIEKFSRSQEYIHGLRIMTNKIKEFQSEMLEYATRYQEIICKNLEPLYLTFGVVEKLDKSLQDAVKTRFLDTSRKPEMTTFDCLLEQRLKNTVRRIETERSMLTNDIRFIHFIAQDDFLKAQDEESDELTFSQFKDFDSDLALSLLEFGLLANGFILSTKRTFMALHALKKVDSCLGFSVSKLDSLEFNLRHKKTYLDVRNAVLGSICDIKPQNVKPNSQRCRPKRYGITRAEPQMIPKGKIRILKSQYSLQENRSQPEYKSPGITLPCVSRRFLHGEEGESSFGRFLNPASVETQTPKSRTQDKQREKHTQTNNNNMPMVPAPSALSSEKSTLSGENQLGKVISHERGTILTGNTVVDRAMCERTASNEAKGQGKKCGRTCAGSTLTFLFYTKGVGVYANGNSRMVDENGLPLFPKEPRLAERLALPQGNRARFKANIASRSPTIDKILQTVQEVNRA